MQYTHVVASAILFRGELARRARLGTLGQHQLVGSQLTASTSTQVLSILITGNSRMRVGVEEAVDQTT